MTIHLGIDPGLHGGLALLMPHGIAVKVMPVDGKWIQCGKIHNWLFKMAEMNMGDVRATVELVGAFPGQGVCSVFTFGTGWGQIIGMLQTLCIPYTLVRPQAWKKVVLAGTNKDKEAAIAYCMREYPNVPLIPEGCRVAHDGIADALCLARYGEIIRG